MMILTEQDMVEILQIENDSLYEIVHKLMAENERLRAELDETEQSQ